jgi:hypothetical protein
MQSETAAPPGGDCPLPESGYSPSASGTQRIFCPGRTVYADEQGNF